MLQRAAKYILLAVCTPCELPSRGLPRVPEIQPARYPACDQTITCSSKAACDPRALGQWHLVVWRKVSNCNRLQPTRCTRCTSAVQWSADRRKNTQVALQAPATLTAMVFAWTSTYGMTPRQTGCCLGRRRRVHCCALGAGCGRSPDREGSNLRVVHAGDHAERVPNLTGTHFRGD